jgi:hypothetical protein
MSSGVRRKGLKVAARATWRQKASRATRTLAPTRGEAVRRHRRVHRARRGAGDAVDFEPGLLQQPVDRAPGEGAMCAAALQREVHEQRLAPRGGGGGGSALCQRCSFSATGLSSAGRLAASRGRRGAGRGDGGDGGIEEGSEARSAPGIQEAARGAAGLAATAHGRNKGRCRPKPRMVRRSSACTPSPVWTDHPINNGAGHGCAASVTVAVAARPSLV